MGWGRSDAQRSGQRGEYVAMSARMTPSALTFARLLGAGPMARVALEASLNELEGPAYIVSGRGTVIHANVAGTKRVERSPKKLRQTLAAVVSDREASARIGALVTPLRCESAQTYFLVVFRAPSSMDETLVCVTALWELTRRQTDVLRLLMEGFSNKTIAVKLSCAERTVETHLTAIFDKSGYDGRSTLFAALARWRG